jgi:hypothetical protein
MSQNSRNKPGETGNSGRGMNDSPERKSYEGFEGMNYEQVRQPYPSQEHGSNRSPERGNKGQDHRNDEM